MYTRNDRLLIAILFVVSFLPLAFFAYPSSEENVAVISVAGEVQALLPLSGERQEKKITTPEGSNVVVVENGRVTVSEADCPDKICVAAGHISRTHEAIACLPHKLLVEIKPRQ